MQFRHSLGFVAAFLLAMVFAPFDASAKVVEITISKISQKMTVRVDGDIEYVWPVSTGASGYETPSGKFRPFRMEKEHFSKEWDDAPMPHAIFFTDRGHAIHGSYHVKSLGRRASHGCVRLHPDNAAKLFALVSDAGMSNTKVVLKGGLFDFGSNSRSFAQVGDDMEKVIKKKDGKPRGLAFLFGSSKKKTDKDMKPKKVSAKKSDEKAKKLASKKPDDKKKDDKATKVAAKTPDVKVKKPEDKAKKAAEKCVTKDGKKVCTKAPAAKAAAAG